MPSRCCLPMIRTSASSSLKLSHLFENSIRSAVVLEAIVCAGRPRQTDGTNVAVVLVVVVGRDWGVCVCVWGGGGG